jgi:hydrogenase maturation protease
MADAKLVLGIGNLLLRDEGVGVRVVQAMERATQPSPPSPPGPIRLPPGVELADGGTAGGDLLDLICGRELLIVVDAIDADAEPGTILRFDASELIRRPGHEVSLHQVGLLETLRMAELLGQPPGRTVILGVAPASIEPGLELTPAVAAVVPRVIELVLTELRT